jgi:IS605 OrfB family transposase
MKLSFKFKPKYNDKTLAIIEELSFHTTKLYNTANYECRETEFKPYVKTNEMYATNWHAHFLHSHTYQQCLRVLEKNWKSYFASIKDYKKNPSKYKGMPQKPKFKNNKNKNEIIFTNLAIRVKENTLMLSLSKSMQEKFRVKSLNFNLPEKIKSLVNLESIQQIKINWDSVQKEWYLIVIYNRAEQKLTLGTNIMSIDLGLDNLATISFKDAKETYIINGKPLKSRNSYLNKEIARLQSVRMKQIGSTKFKDTNIISKLRQERAKYINDYLHKASRQIINLALKHGVFEIVIGDIKDIKQNCKIKSFVQIPVQKLVELIEYKAELLGISVVKIKENYTSGVSAIDLEEISKEFYNKSRRVNRGMFVTNTGIKINADVNGSLNILRKHLKDECIPKLIQSVRDNGLVNSPVRIRVA